MIDREALVAALMRTSFVVNTGAAVTPVGGSRPMSGTEANDVADLVFGASPGREGSPFPDDQGDDAETTEALRGAAATRVRVHLEWVSNVLGEHGHAAVLDEAVHELEEIAARTGRPYSFSSASVPVTTTPPQSGIDTCRHHPFPRVHPRYEIQESGHAPED